MQGVYNTAYRCAYRSDTSHAIRVGVYRNFDTYNFVFVSKIAINPIDIRLVFNNANDETIVVREIDRIDTAFSSGGGGYRNGFAIAPDSPVINITTFTSLGECLEAIGFNGGEEGADIIVTIDASSDANAIIVEIGGSGEGLEQVDVTINGKQSTNDTNEQGGISDDGGGEGTFDDTSDPIPPSIIPTFSCTNSGLVTLFRPSESQLKSLGAYLWTNITDFIENLNKLFMNPMDYLIALNIFPVVPIVGAEREIKIGSFTTSITMPPVISQWYDFDCGTIMIPKYWGSYLDYAPYTKIHAMLPFVGSVQLNTDEVMNRKLGLRYRIDLLSGMCVAMVLVDDSVYYQFTGECGVAVPLTGADWSRVYSAAIGAIGTAIAGGVGIGLAGQTASTGVSAVLAQAKSAEAAASNVGAFGMLPSGVKGVQAMRNHAEQAAQLALQAGQNAASAQAGMSGAIRATRIASTVNATVNQVMSGKGYVTHSGTISGSSAILGVRTPYVMLEYPNQSLPDNYKHFVGYPSNIMAKLGTLSGYTECEQVIVTGLPNASDGEIEELTTALKEGVYL